MDQGSVGRLACPAGRVSRGLMFGLVGWLRSFAVTKHQVRAEVFALGGRHLGQVLDGARTESRAPGISLQRAILLKAVIRSQPRSGD